MKKLLLLLLTMCTALCANASDLGFEVEVNGNTVTVKAAGSSSTAASSSMARS